MTPLRLVLHGSAADRWHTALSPFSTLVQHEPPPETRVDVNGSAVSVLQGRHDWLTRMQEDVRASVTVQGGVACPNAHDIEPDTLPQWADLVPAGVIALAQAQANGFADLKP